MKNKGFVFVILSSSFSVQGMSKERISAATPEAVSLPIIENVHKDEFTSLLREQGLDSTDTDVRLRDSGQTLLSSAVERGSLEDVRLLVRSQVAVNKVDKYGLTSLYEAALNNRDEIALMLLAAGADVESLDAQGVSLLHRASFLGHLPVVKFLLDHGAGINNAINGELTALDIAALGGRPDVVDLLLKVGAEKARMSKMSALMNAILGGATNPMHELIPIFGTEFASLFTVTQNGHAQVVKLLLNAGSDANEVSDDNVTPLCLAAFGGQAQVVELLLQKGAAIDQAGKDGLTPLHAASNFACFDSTQLLTWANKHRLPVISTRADGHIAVVEMLLRSGANNKKSDNKGATPLHTAAFGGQVQVVKLLLEFGADKSQPDKKGATALHMAATNGSEMVARFVGYTDMIPPFEFSKRRDYVQVIKLLLEVPDASIKKADENGITPLYIAAKEGTVQVVELFLKAGASIDVRTNFGETPLFGAVRAGNFEVVNKLLDEGAKVNLAVAGARIAAGTTFGETPLICAAKNGHVDIVKRLLAVANVSIDKSDDDGATALYKVAMKGNIQIVELLLQAGADTEVRTNFGETPLFRAVKNGHASVVRMLLKAGAKVDASVVAVHIAADGTFGETALFSASKNGQTEIVNALLAAGANLNTAVEGCVPLHIAAKNGHVEVVKVLLAKEASQVNAASANGSGPLYFASQNGHSEVVQILLATGAQVNGSNKLGKTSVQAAAQNGHTMIVAMLLAAGAEVNSADNDGSTSLHRACEHGHIEVVKLLLAAHADKAKSNNKGKTALQIAITLSHTSIVQLLSAANVLIPAESNPVDLRSHFDASANKTDKDVRSPYSTAAGQVAESLLAASGHEDKKNKEAVTPLFSAAQNGHVHVVQELINAKVDCDETCTFRGTLPPIKALFFHKDSLKKEAVWNNSTPLQIAALNGHVQIVRLLSEAGADLNRPNDLGLTPLLIASLCGHYEVVEALLKVGVDINQSTLGVRGGAAGLEFSFVVACSPREAELIKLLLDVWHVHYIGEHPFLPRVYTPLILAAASGNAELVKLLLSKGSQHEEAADDSSVNALCYAVGTGNVPVVELLVAAGVRVNKSINSAMVLIDQYRSSIVEIAQGEGHDEIVALLLEAGRSQDRRFKGMSAFELTDLKKKLHEDFLKRKEIVKKVSDTVKGGDLSMFEDY